MTLTHKFCDEELKFHDSHKKNRKSTKSIDDINYIGY